jgi:hypothetical protein
MIDDDREGAIRARAYQLWIESGYADGYQEAHWRQAEQELGGKGEVRELKPIARSLPRDTRHVDGMSLYPSVLDPAPAAAA